MGRFKENQKQNQRSEVKNLMKIIAGVDEVGRGSLIGPVYASAVILKNKTFPLIITFNPSYLIRFPEYKKHSWEDLKKIREKIKHLKLKI